MEILVVGKGGREHSLVFHLRKYNPDARIHVIPGNDGMQENVIRVSSISEDDVDSIVNYAKKNNIKYVFIGSEFPLHLGLSDKLNQLSILTFGVSKQASRLETSKVFAKSLMKRYNIPTANYIVFTTMEQVVDFFNNTHEVIYPKVIKVDGLASGKGVFIVYTQEEALNVFNELMIEKKFNDAANLVILEDYIEGREASIFVLFDSNSFIPMASVQDYKKLNEGDSGPNTGGMGAYMPISISTEMTKKIEKEILNPIAKAFKELSIEYKGILYIGLKILDNNIYVLEFNVRFGDPEAQVILPLLDTNLVDILEHIGKNQLRDLKLKWRNKFAVCVVLAKKGYPNNLSKEDFLIKNLDLVENQEDLYIFHAGTKKKDENFYAVNGRVLNIVGVDSSISLAKKKAYYWASKIHFDHMNYRLDIANDDLN